MTTEHHARRFRPILLTLGIVALLIVALVGYVAWYVFIPHRHEPGAATTAADVEAYTGASPPAAARELRIAAFEAGQLRLAFVRFKAPADICRAYAAKVLPDATLRLVNRNQMYNDLFAIYSGSRKLRDLRWFDLPDAKKFWQDQGHEATFSKPEYEDVPPVSSIIGANANMQESGYLSTSVYIDDVNGVFYCILVN